MDGILLVDKPSGWTSFDVVAKVRGIARQATGVKKFKVGHTGTLDPLAAGLLVLTLGNYCKRAQEFSKMDKTYQVIMKLGQTSTTGDEEGEKTLISDTKPTEQAVKAALEHFKGEIFQIPPAYSAVKIGGQRAYKLARQGKQVIIEPRKVKIYEIVGITYAYPEVKFSAKVSSGTYIRSLVEDAGKLLDTGAYMSGLCRTKIGQFEIEQAISPSDLSIEQIRRHILLA